nr:immunoglobulin heavy chain junction region [Macaca mulatta]MOW50715.1 immunoglobulin heavy chain junction region [Macaca mulatta]
CARSFYYSGSYYSPDAFGFW